MKKTLAAALALLLAFSFACPAALADGVDRIEVEQYEIRLPEIAVYFHPLAADGTPISDFASDVGDIKAVLGNKPLSVDALEPYAGGTAYYFLLDVSGSIPKDVFEAIRGALSAFVGGMSSDDAIVLIAFGETVNALLDGTESRETALEAIASLKAGDKITRFFDGVSAAIAMAESKTSTLPSRRVAFVFTDGKDVSTGGGTTVNEIRESLVGAGLPLYAFGIGSNKTYLDALGEFARSAGGSFASVDRKNCADALSSTVERVESCYVLRLRADSNVIDAAVQQLIVKFTYRGQTLSVSENVAVNDWIPDTEAPRVDDLYISGPNELTLCFSESVRGADNAANYSVNMLPAGGAAQAIAVRAAAYDDAARAVKLTFAETLYTGDYELSLINIADRSMEANPLSDASVRGVNLFGTQLPSPTPGAPGGETSPGGAGAGTGTGSGAGDAENFPLWVILAVAGALGAVAVFVVILAAKKKPREEAPGGSAAVSYAYDPPSPANTGVRIPGAAGARCRAVVIDAAGVQRQVEFTAYGPYGVGRSHGACDMAVDDKQLSRRHFALTFEEGRIFIEDLGSTNGTEVNGVPVIGKRMLGPADVVTAGNSKFRFTLTN